MPEAHRSPGDRFSGDVASLTVIRLVGVGAGFLTSVVAARLLGPADFGIAGVAQTVGTIVALIANGGLAMSSIYLLRRATSGADRLVAALTGFAVCSITLAALAGVAAALGVSRAGVEGMAGVTAVATGLLAAAIVAADAADSQLLGLGRSRSYTIAEGIRTIGALAGTTAILLVVTTAAGYTVGVALGLLAAASFALHRTRRIVGRFRPAFDRAVWRNTLAYGLRGQVGNVLQYFTLRLDIVFVAAILGAAPAGIYLVATRVSEVVTQIANAAATLLFPAVAGQDDHRDTSLTESTVRVVTVLVSLSALAVGVASAALLTVVFGAAYAEALPALWVLLLAAIPLSIGRLLGGDLKGRGHPGLVSVASVVGLAIMVVGDLATLASWGIVGAAAISLVAYTATAVGIALGYRAISGGSLGALVPRVGDVAVIGRFVVRWVRRR